MTSGFRDLLKREGPIIFDGAMGTSLQQKRVPQDTPLERLNLTHPHMVADVHSSYGKVGVDVIETNTFGANRIKLERYGLGDEMEIINRKGVKIAREVDFPCLIGASIGPLGVLLKPWGTLDPAQAFSAFKEQIEVVSAEGADLIVIETMMSVEEAKIAIRAAKEVCETPIVCQLTFEKNGKTLMGEDPSSAANIIGCLGIDALGANCSVGPESLFPVAEKMCIVSRLPLIFQPNAGEPHLKEDKTIYPVGPGEMADWMERFVNLGVKIVGGCCGSTPAHLKAVVERVKDRRVSPCR